MSNLKLSEVHNNIYKCFKNAYILKGCSLYGLYKANGGRRDCNDIFDDNYKSLQVIAFAYEIYYSVLDELSKKNKNKKTKDIGIRDLINNLYTSERAMKVARNLGHQYDKNVKIQSNFCGNSSLMLIILSTVGEVNNGKVTRSGLHPINVTIDLNSEDLFHRLALAHALAFCNALSPNCISEDMFKSSIEKY